MKTSRFTIISRELEKRIHRESVAKVPPVRELAERYGVSVNTAWRALQVLERKGLLHGSRGRGTYVAGTKKIPDCAAERLAQAIRVRISQGTYRVGTEIPKQTRFAVEEHVSCATVSAAFRILCKQDLIHKRGMRFIVGPAKPLDEKNRRSSYHLRPTAPVVVLIFHGTPLWYRITQQFLPYSTFHRTLEDELRRAGVRPCYAVLHPRPGEPFPGGREQISRLITDLGDRYIGTLLHWKTAAEFLEDHVRWLSRYHKPVAVLDVSDNAPTHACISVPQRRGRRMYYRFYVDEERAAQRCVQRISELGHIRIGIPLPRPQGYVGEIIKRWTNIRLSHIRKYAAECSPPLRIITIPEKEDFLLKTLYEHQTPLRDLPAPLSVPDTASPEFKKALWQKTPSLRNLLSRHNVTALIGLNDRLSLPYCHWLSYMGISVPEDVSLISFDNNPYILMYGLSSMDFGYQDMGYLAAHVFIKDIPVRTDDRYGNICGREFIADRGSLGVPRKKPVAIQY